MAYCVPMMQVDIGFCIYYNKGDQIDCFKKLYAWVDTHQGVKIKWVRTDGDWTTTEWTKFKEEKGIEQYQTTTNHPRSNGVAERTNGVVTTMARTLLIAANLPPTFLGESLQAAIYILNRTHSMRSGPQDTPLERMKQMKFYDLQLRAYGCHAWVTSTKSLGKALPRATEGILIGYDEQRRGYRIYCSSENKILVSDSVVFDEKTIGLRSPRKQVPSATIGDLFDSSAHHDNSTPPSQASWTKLPTLEQESQAVSNSNNGTCYHKETKDQDSVDDTQDDLQHEETQQSALPSQTLRRSDRQAKPSAASLESIAYQHDGQFMSFFDDYHDFSHAFLTESISIPPKHAWQDEHWKKAMKKELQDLELLGTYTQVARPSHRSVIGGKWVFAKKGSSTADAKYKARYVCKGYSQMHGQDFNETWSPTLRGQSIRLLVALSAAGGAHLRHLDVKNAFCNAPLEEEIYVEIPFGAPGYGQDFVWRLKKALYGLKQAGREWNRTFSKGLKRLGFKQTASEPCLFAGSSLFTGIIIGVYVDDCIVMYRDENKLKELITCLQEKFPIKDEGELKNFVGIQISRNENTVKLHQSLYLLSVLKKFKYEDSHPVSTPRVASPSSTKNINPSNTLTKFGMKAIVGALLYLSIHTRPDIAYAVSRLAQTVRDPSPADFQAAARVLRYLNGTRSLGIHFCKDKDKPTLRGYVDSTWGDYIDGKSHSGYVLTFGGPIDWCTKKQSMVCLSSSEAELIAAVDAGKSVRWYRSLLGELGYTQTKPTPIFEDNTGAIVLAHTSVIGKRTRHVNIRYHCMNDWVSSGDLMLQKVTTAKNTADIFTKALDKILFQRFSSKLVS